MRWGLGLLLLLQLKFGHALDCQQPQQATVSVPVQKTNWMDTTHLVVPRFNGALGDLDSLNFFVSYSGNSTFSYGFDSGGRQDTNVMTPSLTTTQVGLSFPPNQISVGNFNLLSANFDRNFQQQIAYDESMPENCPDPMDISSCDINVLFLFSGTASNDVTDADTLAAFVGPVGSTQTFGALASGSALGVISPSNGGNVVGTLSVGVGITITYYSTQLTLQKLQNGVHYGAPTGPIYPVSQAPTIVWQYNVTNYGSATLGLLQIFDTGGVQATCVPDFLFPCSWVICNGTSQATHVGQYMNIANCTVFGLSTQQHVCPTDVSYYFGAAPQISIRKFTNNLRPNAGVIIQGLPVVWTYVVTNIGNVPLSSVAVDDNQLVAGSVSCPMTALNVNAFMTCSASGTAQPIVYTNTGTAHGFYPPTAQTVTATDVSGYTGQTAMISIHKWTNGVDTQVTAAPLIQRGSQVTWVYAVTNIGSATLTSVQVRDNKLAAVVCLGITLTSGQVATCTATGVATATGAYTNIGTALGVSPAAATVGVAAATVTSTYPSAYFGGVQQISVLKYTNNVDIRFFPAPNVLIGFPVTWVYAVTNTGNLDLTSVTVTDNQVGPAICPPPSTTLSPGALLTCSALGSATTTGTYTNVGTAQGVSTLASVTNVTYATVRATSNSAYFGLVQAITLVKFTNGVDIRTTGGAGPYVVQGTTVTWAYRVTNIGNSALSAITVTDNQVAGNAQCPNPPNLAIGGTFVCTFVGVAISGTYNNVGTATGVSPAAQIPGVTLAQATVTATSPSNYLGIVQTISIVKYTQGINTVVSPAPVLLVGSRVTWTYAVTNTGNIDLTSVTVTDNRLAVNAVTCPVPATLPVGNTFTCTASGTATAVSYTNIGTSRGVSIAASQIGVAAATVTATAPSQYVGIVPGISIVKTTNGVDTRVVPSGPQLVVGSPVTWTYVVSNVGSGDLSVVSVVDNKVGATVSCPSSTLVIGAVMTCQAFGTAVASTYTNIGTAIGTSSGSTFTATSPSAYFGVLASISIVKFTNGVNTNSGAAPPFILQGQPVTWKYAVTNTGNSVLSTVNVVDNLAGIAVCPASATLAVGSTFTCLITGTAIAGTYNNVGTSTGTSPAGNMVTATSPSAYFGVIQSITIIKYTNGVDTGVNSPPQLVQGQPVTWTYQVTNNGNTDLSTVTVTDNRLSAGAVTCPIPATLTPGSSFFCTATGVASTGPYNNIGTANGRSPIGQVTSTYPSSYIGVPPGITLVKFTNGVQTPPNPKPQVQAGAPVTWTFAVTNVGTSTLFSIVVSDNDASVNPLISCPSNQLLAGASMTCTAVANALTTNYNNVGTATGVTANGVPATSTSPSGYVGLSPAITIVKYTNDVNTNAPGASFPQILAGGSVTWKYAVTNTGNSALSLITVTDNQGVVPVCPSTNLNQGQTFTCSVTGIAILNNYNNIGTAVGTSPLNTRVTATSPSGYIGVQPSISLLKLTNDIHVDQAANAVGVDPGSPVTWKYIVSNTGNSVLSVVTVVDDQIGAIGCPANTLALGASFACSATGIAITGSALYHNTATATGLFLGAPVTSVDQSWYNPVTNAMIELLKLTNGVDIRVNPVPVARVGYPVTWTYEVTNTGSVVLSSVVVTDDLQGLITCPKSGPLAPNEVMTCTQVGTAIDCYYQNVGTVTASRGTKDVSNSAYIGILPLISIQKFTNSYPHDTLTTVNSNYPPFIGPCITEGSLVTWTYVVSNIGDDLLTNVVVDDDQLGPNAVCVIDQLGPWWSATCKAEGYAPAGQYHNVATAIGYPATAGGPPVNATTRTGSWVCCRI